MEDLQDSEKFAFEGKKEKSRIRQLVDDYLKDKQYEEEKVAQWVNDICEATIDLLHQAKKPFKYVVTCAIMQRTGAAIHSANTCFWDTVSDVSIAVSWPRKKTQNVRDANANRTICAIVTVFAISFYPS